jgi:hypothetical protein
MMNSVKGFPTNAKKKKSRDKKKRYIFKKKLYIWRKGRLNLWERG